MEVYISLEIGTAVCVFVCACVSYLCDVLLYFCLKTKQTKKQSQAAVRELSSEPYLV